MKNTIDTVWCQIEAIKAAIPNDDRARESLRMQNMCTEFDEKHLPIVQGRSAAGFAPTSDIVISGGDDKEQASKPSGVAV